MSMRWALPLLLVTSASACTVFIVGKDASTDGSTMVSHSNDGEFDTDPRLVSVPRQPKGQRPVYFSPESYPRYVGTARGIPEYFPTASQTPFEPMRYIPQPDTYAYLEETYGALNEHGLAIGESTCSGVFGALPLSQNGTALFSIDELTHIAMEQTRTAREAILLMGSLAEEYGFYGAGEFEGTAESLGVTDLNEAWIFHILPDPTGSSAIWAAQKIPSHSVAVLANMFVIRQVDPDDDENFLCSKLVHEIALEYQWWDPSEGLLDFTKVYSDGEYAHKYYSGRRMWGGYRLMGRNFPDDYVDLQSDPVYPVFAVPAKPISEQDLFRFHRDYYEGTKYDLGAPHLAGGPFGNPDRYKEGANEARMVGNFERSIGLFRTSDTYVAKNRRDSSTLWYGPAAAMGTVFTPFVVGMTIPQSFSMGHHFVFNRTTAFWAACVVHNVASLKWNYAIKDIRARQQKLEKESTRMVEDAAKQFAKDGDAAALHTQYAANAAKIVSSWWSLSDELLFKYASGFVNEPVLSTPVGYPKWWLEEVGYADGPPPPPTVPKCCNPPKPPPLESSVAARVE